jgi:hypothetical protein
MQTYKECIKELDRVSNFNRWFDEYDMETVEAILSVEEILGTKCEEKLIDLIVAYTAATLLVASSCKARWIITKKSHPKKKEREEAEEQTRQNHSEYERKRDIAYIVLKKELMGEEEFMQMQQAQEELMEAWARASREGLI